jgi:hypothetical protein
VVDEQDDGRVTTDAGHGFPVVPEAEAQDDGGGRKRPRS